MTNESETTSEETSSLSSLAQVLEEADYGIYFRPRDEIDGIEKVFVTIGKWEEEILIMKFVSLEEIRRVSGGKIDAFDPEILHGTLVLPFSVTEERLSEVSAAIQLFNRLSPTMSFVLDERGGVCYLQLAVCVEPKRDFPSRTVTGAMSRVGFVVEAFGRQLQDVASGKLTLEACRAQLGEQGILLDGIKRESFTLESLT